MQLYTVAGGVGGWPPTPKERIALEMLCFLNGSRSHLLSKILAIHVFFDKVHLAHILILR